MMKQPILVIMAAGMGSRFGGLKQMAPVDDAGHVIIDYSMYDAMRAGFRKIVCIIKDEMTEDFEKIIASRVRPHMELDYAYQRLSALPAGYAIPEGRTKPWGTAHAIMSAASLIDAPFAVINADDFYGRSAYETMYRYLSCPHGAGEHAMVGYLLKNTLSDSGYVSRGVCSQDADGRLTNIVERLKIEKCPGGGAFTEDDGKTYAFLPGDTLVSMNFFGFQTDILPALSARFPAFLDQGLAENPKKCEYLLPRVAGELITEGKASMNMLTSADNWYGITYSEDMPAVQAAIRDMKTAGKYPAKLWD